MTGDNSVQKSGVHQTSGLSFGICALISRSVKRAFGAHAMSRITLGIICGLVYGALSARASMIPLEFTDKRAALTGAFLNRFGIGFVIGAARLPIPD